MFLLRNGKIFINSIESNKIDMAESHYLLYKNSFEYFALSWLLYKRSHLKESSFIKYINTLNIYILKPLGHQRISKINASLLTDFINDLLLHGGTKKEGLSLTTIESIFSIIKNILIFAEQQGESISRDIDQIRIKKNPSKMRILSLREQVILQEYIFSQENIFNKGGLAIMISLFTGMRIGEICALKWTDISLKDNTITINKTMQRLQDHSGPSKTKVMITAPKSEHSQRVIPIIEGLQIILQSLYAQGDAYVLTGQEDRFIEPRTLQNQFHKIASSCGIENVCFHSLRHTFATRAIEAGIDIKCLSEILGHSSVHITMDCYVHPSMDLKKKNMNKMSAYYLSKRQPNIS